MGLITSLKYEIEDLLLLAKAGIALVANFLTGFLPLLVPFAENLAKITLVGVVLVALRIAIIELSPFIADKAQVFATATNVFIKTFAAIIDGIKIAIYGIMTAIDFIIGKDPPQFPDLNWPKKITVTRILHFSQTVSDVCPAFNSAGTILDFSFKQAMHPVVCPILRATSPVRLVNVTLPALIGFLSYDYEPYPGHNCEHHENFQPKGTCVFLGAGIVFLEVLLPLLLIGIWVATSANIFFAVLRTVLNLISRSIELAFDIAFKAAKILEFIV